MIYKRLIGCIIVRGGIAVQSFGFRKYLPVGKPEIVAENLCRWGVDEIILLDIDATPSNQGPNYKLVEKVAERIFTPLTVGGGVKSLGHFKALLNAGADKIALNSIAIKEPTLITKASESFGKQCIIASIDTYEANGECTVWSRFEDLRNHFMPVKHLAIQMEQCGAGEILLNCISRDGARSGYNIELMETAGKSISIPIIAVGGAGHPNHVLEALTNDCVSAVAVGNMFNHSEHSVSVLKAYLSSRGIPIRQGGNFDYRDSSFDEEGRLIKTHEAFLDSFGPIELEIDSL